VIRAGDYELLSPLGHGGMGDVWAARHERLPVDAAVKLVRSVDAEVFRAEVRAVASLDHPHVVRIFDHGVVPADAFPELWRGNLWYAMERATDGAVPRGPHPWPFVRGVLLALLDALAHAHARGLLHRDLKPGNLLLTRDRPGGPQRVLLADFGIAHVLDPDRVGSGSGGSGTPGYMAPEQLEADERALGPWTDLYALGGVAWVLLTGERPFGRGPLAGMMAAQLDGHLPPLPPGDAPPGTEGFLHGLLRRRTDERFQCAADAAAALLALPGTGPQPGVRVVSSALTELETLLLPSAGTPARVVPPRVGAAPPSAPWCSGWARPTLPRPVDHLVHVAAAHNLFGLRRPAPVAREAEREVLWRLLGHVHATRRRASALVLGPGGAGRTHLLSWLAERATELGAARVLTAHPGDDAAGLARRFTRTAGLADTELRAALAGIVPEAFLPLALGLLAPDVPGAVRLVGRERAVGLARLLTACADRPVLVVLDDLHASVDAAGLFRDLGEGAGALYVVGSADETLLAEAPAERAILDAHPAVRVTLSPWSRAASQALLRALLPLDGPLEAELVEAGGGNPRWLVEVVTAGVRARALTPDGAAFRAAPGVDPASLRADPRWESRVDGILRALDPGSQQAVEVLAALGPRVTRQRWTATCAALGLPAHLRDLEPFTERLLVSAAPGEPLRVLHPRLVDALRTRSVASGRWQLVQRACAATAPDEVERSLHLVLAGAGDERVDTLWTAFHAEWSTGSRSRSAALATALDTLAARPAAAPRTRALGAVVRAVVALGGHRPVDALPIADAAVEAAEASGDPLARAWALRCRFRWFRVAGRVDEAVEAVQACLAAAAPLSDDAFEAEVRLEWANAMLTGGRNADAVTLLEAARALPYVQLHADAWGRVHLSLGSALQHAQRPEDAAAAYGAALDAFDRCGSIWGRAQTISDRANLWSAQGVADEDVRAAHQLAIELFSSIGHPSVAFPKVNLGFLELERGRPELARPLFDEAAAVFEGRASQVVVRGARLFCLAASGDWAGVQAEVDGIDAVLQASAVRGYGAPRWVREAATLADARGEGALGERLRDLADRYRA
jgi:tetratricopeptide (TPR) repeat protein